MPASGRCSSSGVPAAKDGKATGAYAADGVVQRAVQKVKEHLPEMVVVTDVCACEYTDHGHCGFVGETVDGPPDLLNDPPSLELMAQIAVSHAESGADIVARRACSTGWSGRSGRLSMPPDSRTS